MNEPAAQLFRAVGLALQPGAAFDVAVRGDRIESITRRDGAVEWMLLPPLADLHLHANRAHSLGPVPPTSLEHAGRMAVETFRNFGEDDFAEHARTLFAQARARGTTRLRTHADVDALTDMRSVRGTLRAAADFSATLDVEVVAFASSSCDPVESRGRDALVESCRLGAGLLGAVPAFCRDPRASIEALLDLAIRLGVRVDVHLDEHLDAARSTSGFLAEATLARGLGGRVTLSHGCAISTLDASERGRVADALARAQITLISLPMTNLYLQDRSDGAPLRRGLAPVRELARAGVPLRFASDNVRDVFYPYGTADLLDVALLAATAAQVDDPRLLVEGICDGRAGLAAGEEASFVLVRGGSLTEIIAERPRDRIVVRRGLRHS